MNQRGKQVVKDLRTMISGCTCGGAAQIPKGGSKVEEEEKGEDVEMEGREEGFDKMVPLSPKMK